MSNILGKEVIQLKSGITVETIEADEDYRIGRIAAKVANRVKVAWNGTNDYIYINLDELDKLDNSTYIYPIPLNPVITVKVVKRPKLDESATHVILGQ
jgi:hypothetical protein